MAWRDGRHHWQRLFLFLLSIVMGTAALVAIQSMSDNLKRDIDEQAKTLLGADLVISSRQPFSSEVESFIDSLGGKQSREITFASMIYFKKNNGTRLIQVKSVEGAFPYYGALETVPSDAAGSFRQGGRALVDHGLMLQFGAEVGDTITLGSHSFVIEGRLQKVPGESAATQLVSPPVYISMRDLESTNLMKRGSRVVHRVYFKFDEKVDMDVLSEEIKPRLRAYQLGYETVESRKANLGKVFGDLYRYLNLVGFIALLLGCLGVASAVHVFINQKIPTIAVLRCIGARAKDTFAIHLIQVLCIAMLGAFLGAAAGSAIQIFLPGLLKEFIPVEVNPYVSWNAILRGLTISLSMALLFALLPLISIRKVSPLHTLRSTVSENNSRDIWRGVILVLIVAVVSIFSGMQIGRWSYGIGFTAAMAVVFGLIILIAKLMMRLVKTSFPRSWSYVWRQALANLYRPHNQTVMLMLSIGLGTFLIVSLYLTQDTLIKQIAIADSGKQPNLVFFDIQTDQQEEAEQMVRSMGAPVIQKVPIVTMRVAAIKGLTMEEIRKDSNSTVPRWVQEFRCTYRDTLTNTETILSGHWGRPVVGQDSILISVEKGMAENLNVSVGDTIVFDVQGVMMTTIVGSIREVNWRRVQPNFFVVFPTGVLESAPQFWVLVTRVTSAEMSASLQQAMVKRFPNISAVDLALILRTVDAILEKISFVIRFMALFSIGTGFVVLIGAILTSRFQRIQESVLLRTLGAVRKQIARIMGIEYLWLGSFAALSGCVLALLGSWALAFFVFDTPYDPVIMPVAVVFILIVGLTVFLGMFITRDISRKPPLEVLRKET
ncbi:ABC transporter permease [bacterium]|nr:ABC transporter permease [bacterium]